LTIREIWCLSETGNEEADRTISEKDLEKYTGAVVEGKIPWVEIRQMDDQRLAIDAAKKYDVVAVSGPGYSLPQRIALENIIAETQKGGTKLFSFANSFEDVYAIAHSLEAGVNVIVRDAKLIRVFRNYFSPIKLELGPVEIKSNEEAGSGWRCCIDTGDLMSEGEGMLVGSFSSGYFLVHSETAVSEFTEPREFRVNAGVVSNYIITDKKEDGLKTKYLKEIRSGQSVLVLNHKGDARRATVGRNKIEYRPLRRISTENYSILLQDAETVCLTSAEGKPVSVCSLKKGDYVLVCENAGGMHFGTQISEGIIEQ